MKKGSKVRVLATNKVGTVSDSEFFVLGNRKHIRVEVKFDDKPEPVWYKREELGCIYEDLMMKLSDDRGRSIIFDMRYDHGSEQLSINVDCCPKNIQLLKNSMIGSLGYMYFETLKGKGEVL